MALFLQADVSLLIRDEGVVLCREAVPVYHVLGVGEALALAWLGAKGDYESAAEACGEWLPDGEKWVKRFVKRYWPSLGDGPPRPLALSCLSSAAASRPISPILPM